jgi:UDPglucose 6-dehydrogenase
LLNERAKIFVYDPKIKQEQVLSDLDYLNSRDSHENKQNVVCTENAYEACQDAHAVAILTEWDEFKTYDWQKIYDLMQKPAFLFDGRNILKKSEMEKIGFKFWSIGS